MKFISSVRHLSNLKSRKLEPLSFKVSSIEDKRIREFWDSHELECPGNRNGGRGNYSYIFTPTGIGTIIVIRCNFCGKELDATDLDSW